MSKRLPYYQSEPAEYLAGDIMFCSYAAQGVFSIIRALYWQKDCNLTLNQIKRRCKGADDLINELINEDIIKVNGEAISIYFLDEQFDKATNRAKTNSENGKKGAEARWKNSKDNSESIATPLKSDGESIALREDKIKEDKIKEITIEEKEKLIEDIFQKVKVNYPFYAKQLLSDGEFMEAMSKNQIKDQNKDVCKKTIDKYLKLFLSHLDEYKHVHNNKKEFSINFSNWLRRQSIVKVYPKQDEIRYF